MTPFGFVDSSRGGDLSVPSYLVLYERSCSLWSVLSISSSSVVVFLMFRKRQLQVRSIKGSVLVFAYFVRLQCYRMLVTAYVRVVGAQQQEDIEPQPHFHIKHISEIHVVGPHTRYTKNIQQQRKKK